MGPLAGLRVLELAGIGPAPFAGMLLADMGADVIRVDRTSGNGGGIPSAPELDFLQRGKRVVRVNLKDPRGVEAVLRMVEAADALIEGFRPGVLERLGLGPEACLARNPRLVFGRVTGWGQDGPLAQVPGHDINYIALAGALGAIGRAGQPPTPPLNLVGDYGGGGMLLVWGVLCALFESRNSGRGQVVDAAMVDGAALLETIFYSLRAGGAWRDQRGANILDSGAHFYDVYETADGKYVSIGSIEPQFHAELVRLLELDFPEGALNFDPALWAPMREQLARRFRTRTQQEWCELLEQSDICFAPVLDFASAPLHPHNVARGTFVEVGGHVQPAPAPRFSRTPPALPTPPPAPGERLVEDLVAWGFEASEVELLKQAGVAE
jgi:alpha-methylacyl-CoA racemase